MPPLLPNDKWLSVNNLTLRAGIPSGHDLGKFGLLYKFLNSCREGALTTAIVTPLVMSLPKNTGRPICFINLGCEMQGYKR